LGFGFGWDFAWGCLLGVKANMDEKNNAEMAGIAGVDVLPDLRCSRVSKISFF
jgi:hypothetical protein